MSTNDLDLNMKAKSVVEILKELHSGKSIEELKDKYKRIISAISPFEIPLIEQQLVKEGVRIEEILNLCDLHVELFKDTLNSREIKDIPKGHPLDLLLRENDLILKQSEILAVYASALLKSQEESGSDAKNIVARIKDVVLKLMNIKLHYRKIQMLIFPYLERRGIIAPTRVLWGREDQVRTKLRQLLEFLDRLENRFDPVLITEMGNRALELAREISELVFRENKILYPTVQTLLSEGEWAAISTIAEKIGYIVETKGEKLSINAKPILPYEADTGLPQEKVDSLPTEFRMMITSQGINPDSYVVKGAGDIDLDTGFLDTEEIKAVFKALPLEITFANSDDRVKFFSESFLHKGFVRTKTIIGRRLEYCHPPRLESIVKKTVDEVKRESGHREFWTKMGDRVIRVLIVPVKSREGKYIGSVEIVEDLTGVVNNPEEVKKRITVV
jgi:DUF438 domain-containing protein